VDRFELTTSWFRFELSCPRRVDTFAIGLATDNNNNNNNNNKNNSNNNNSNNSNNNNSNNTQASVSPQAVQFAHSGNADDLILRLSIR
jgi:hypothetical protein